MVEFDIMCKDFENAIIRYDKNSAFALLEKYEKEHEATSFIDNVLVCALENIGFLWEKGQVSLSQIYLSSKICEELVGKMLPMAGERRKKSPKMAIVTLEDHHVLGKRIVSSIVRSSGFDLDDYGHGVSAEEVVEKVAQENVKILLISVLMYPSALCVKKVREGLQQKNLDTKILVGGAPFLFDGELWEKVGADAMGRNAAEDLLIIEKWIKEV